MYSLTLPEFYPPTATLLFFLLSTLATQFPMAQHRATRAEGVLLPLCDLSSNPAAVVQPSLVLEIYRTREGYIVLQNSYTMVFKVKSLSFNVHQGFLLTDVDNNPIYTLRNKVVRLPSLPCYICRYPSLIFLDILSMSMVHLCRSPLRMLDGKFLRVIASTPNICSLALQDLRSSNVGPN